MSPAQWAGENIQRGFQRCRTVCGSKLATRQENHPLLLGITAFDRLLAGGMFLPFTHQPKGDGLSENDRGIKSD